MRAAPTARGQIMRRGNIRRFEPLAHPPLFLSRYFHGVHTKARPRRRLRRQDEDEDARSGGCGFLLHRSRGQHLLTNPRVLDSIVRMAGVRPTDTVLEIGPGTGNLTVRLLQAAGNVVAVEIDDRMVDALRRRTADIGLRGRLTVLQENALKTQFPHFDLCVSNTPYGISSPLIAKLLFGSGMASASGSFRNATLLLQKEFARRLVALPAESEFNRLAANVGLVAEVEHLMDVGKRNFVPVPKVDSSLVQLRPRPEAPLSSPTHLREWLAFTRLCFNTRNKTLGAIFKQKRNAAELFRRSMAGSNGGGSGDNDEALDGDDNAINEDDDDDVAGAGEDEGQGGEGRWVDVVEVRAFKEKVTRVLTAEGFEKRRPSNLTIKELLRLLRSFNTQGIMFH